ncbi:MAG: hypothetical protein A2X36_04200 [Elusimicrobia bacterium GWA2_69_24]|nr:MAG: hypothetical protein A2X36_04200 [Elusimicrobia bacterium GWA2_69_24]HBL16151.1 hypothetical protein [Elusimicrobiota bacterium]
MTLQSIPPQELLRRGRTVNRYATPLGILLVSMGILVTQPVGAVRWLSVGILAFGVVFNLGANAYLARVAAPSSRLIWARLAVNLSANTLLLWLLGPQWPSVWLLLALTPFATALYSDRVRTAGIALLVCVLLLGVQALTGPHSPLEWGIQISHAAFILMISLMLNELSAPLRSV